MTAWKPSPNQTAEQSATPAGALLMRRSPRAKRMSNILFQLAAFLVAIEKCISQRILKSHNWNKTFGLGSTLRPSGGGEHFAQRSLFQCRNCECVDGWSQAGCGIFLHNHR